MLGGKMMSSALLKRTICTSTLRQVQGKMSSKADFLKPHPPGGMKLWRKLTFLVAVPLTTIISINVYLHHQKEHECYKRPKYIPYEYLNIRTKKFPWGDGNHTLFFNRHTQALPTGYEDDDEH